MRVLVVALLLGLCACRTHVQLETWRSDEALWRAAVAISPDRPRPALNLAVALERRGAISEACRWISRASALAVLRQAPDTLRLADGFRRWIAVMHADSGSDSCASVDSL